MPLDPAKSYHICLIVDNPLRDLEGLVLLARQLVARGARVTLTPMYDQGFDVPALQPDLVLLNYVRPNNLDLIIIYKQLGIRVGILDTEGIGGKNPDHFADLVAKCGDLNFIDLYCFWGEAQLDAFKRRGVLLQENLRSTGCPRYDYCVAPWRAALKQIEEPSYILINTNFPTVNPRFSKDFNKELGTMRKVGFSDELSRQFIEDGRFSHKKVIEVTRGLAKRFNDVQFILRPHPFESIGAYDELTKLNNVSIRQEGTSLDWIAGARLLLHQNCSTAIEANMIGVEAVSLEWFNTPTLYLEAATRVSHAVESYEELENLIEGVLDERPLELPATALKFRQEMLRDLYLAIDGHSSERVCTAIIATLEKNVSAYQDAVKLPQPKLRGRLIYKLRSLLGYAISAKVQELVAGPKLKLLCAGKEFSIRDIENTLFRLENAASDNLKVTVRPAKTSNSLCKHRLGPSSLQLAVK